jgi:hypothetical protein
MTLDELAMAAYTAYGDYVEWHNYQGRDMPAWVDLGDRIQGAWKAAASRVAAMLGLED